MGDIIMIYPVATIYGKHDIEITSSKPDKDGSIILNIEQWNPKNNNFSMAQIKLPQEEIIVVKNFTDDELKNIINKIHKLSLDILDYVYDMDSK